MINRWQRQIKAQLRESKIFHKLVPVVNSEGLPSYWTIEYAAYQQVGHYWHPNHIQWKLDLADTDLAENLNLKDTLQKIWATFFYFQYIGPLKIAENLDLKDILQKIWATIFYF